MGYERYPRGTDPRSDYDGRGEPQDYGRDYGSGRGYGYSSARDYDAAGTFDRDRHRDRGDDRRPYGYGAGRFDAQRGYGREDGYRDGSGGQYHGSYAHDGRRFVDVGNRRDWDDDNRRPQRSRSAPPQGYDYDDRGFFARAGDEVRSWFGDEDAERRRELDSRYDERHYASRDDDYHQWRSGQIAALDRDYHEYRNENRSRFENEFSSWRTNRQSQRDLLGQVKEHAEVVGSDGAHVGTVDKVRGDRILLTKNDVDAGGQHHSIPSSWLASVEDATVTLSKTADEAKRQWRAEEQRQALFDYGDNAGRGAGRDAKQDDRSDGRILGRSFSGTY